MPGAAATRSEESRRRAGLKRRTETRRRLLQAADELFRERGYAATTVTAIAERAGLSLQSLYSAWESKSALFRAAADAAVTASGLPMSPEAWRDVIDRELAAEAGADPSASGYLAAVARIFVQVAGRTSVYWQMQPGAAAADPDIAAGHALAMRQRRTTMEHVAAAIPSTGVRIGLPLASVVDTLWSLASPEVYALLVVQAGRTPAEFEEWLTTTLVAALTEPVPSPAAPRGHRDDGEAPAAEDRARR